MIELGIGFHPDLTGRENIYLNTSLPGLSRNQTDQIFRPIVDCSEIEEFIEMNIFKKKCLQRMKEIHGQGRIIILVSHDLGNIERMCDRVYRLQRGSVETVGDPSSVSLYYRKRVNS